MFKNFNFATDLGPAPSLKNLFLSFNEIKKLSGDLEASNLMNLDLTYNNMKRLFVDQFLGKSKNNLTIFLQHNDIESVDFRNLNVSSKDLAQLSIKLDEKITCNCHTVSLYNFLHRGLDLTEEIYRAIEISPPNAKCIKTATESAETVMDIKRETVTCPLDFPHQVNSSKPSKAFSSRS